MYPVWVSGHEWMHSVCPQDVLTAGHIQRWSGDVYCSVKSVNANVSLYILEQLSGEATSQVNLYQAWFIIECQLTCKRKQLASNSTFSFSAEQVLKLRKPTLSTINKNFKRSFSPVSWPHLLKMSAKNLASWSTHAFRIWPGMPSGPTTFWILTRLKACRPPRWFKDWSGLLCWCCHWLVDVGAVFS